MSNEHEDTEEGPRSFSRFVERLDEGEAHAEASAMLHELGQRLRAEAKHSSSKAKGSITLKIDIAVEPNGVAEVMYALGKKDPKPRRAKTILWQTDGGNFTAQNPRQQNLPLKEVGAPKKRAGKEV